MDQPKVLMDALWVTQGGGYEYAQQVVRELSRDSRGLSFSILVPEGHALETSGADVQLLPVRLPSRWPELKLASRFLYEELVLPLRARRFDLFFAPADIAPVIRGVPLVVLAQNLNIYDRSFYDNPRLRILGRLARGSLRRADRVVFPSLAAATAVQASLGLRDELVRVVHYGFAPEQRTSTGSLERGRPYVFLPCALERHKNVEVLIRSVPHLKPDIDVRIAGGSATDPAYGNWLRTLAAERHASERVSFLGPMPRAEVIRLLESALALVFPSKLESFGLPILEAMGAGTSVVASDTPIFRELAGAAGRYFPADDPAALAREIESVRSDPEGTRLRIEEGRALATRFSWQSSVDRLCAVFNELLG